jgi:hypothetical protein
MVHIKGDYNGEWFNINLESGISIGTAIRLQNQGTNRVFLQESNTEPDTSDWSGEIMTVLRGVEPSKVVTINSLTIWARTSSTSEVSIIVQEL